MDVKPHVSFLSCCQFPGSATHYHTVRTVNVTETGIPDHSPCNIRLYTENRRASWVKRLQNSWWGNDDWQVLKEWKVLVSDTEDWYFCFPSVIRLTINKHRQKITSTNTSLQIWQFLSCWIDMIKMANSTQAHRVSTRARARTHTRTNTHTHMHTCTHRGKYTHD